MNKEKPTICRIVYQFAPDVGGAISHVIELATQIHPRFRRQYVVTPKAATDTRSLDNDFVFTVERIYVWKFGFLQRLKTKMFTWLPVFPLITLSLIWASLWRIISLNRRDNIDIIQSHGVGAASIAAFITGKLLRKKVIGMMHGSHEAYSERMGQHETFIVRRFPPDHAFVLDDGSRAPDKFRELLPGKVTVVYHAINTDEYQPGSGAVLRKKLGIEDAFVFLSPHSLLPVKGVEYALEAFGGFLRKSGQPNARLLIAGDGPQRAELESKTVDLGIANRTVFLGEIPQTEIKDYLRASDAVLATSLYSNVNRAVQEAMACAKPVLVFASGGTDRLVTDNETGLSVKPGDTTEMAEKMGLVYNDRNLCATLGDNARRFIIENRSWESRIKLEMEAYAELLKD